MQLKKIKEGRLCGAFLFILFFQPFAAYADRAFVVPGQYIVRYKFPQAGARTRTVVKIGHKKRAERYHRFHNQCAKLKRIKRNIISCTPDFVVRAATDPYVFECTEPMGCNWAIENDRDTDLDLPQAWQVTEGSANVIIAVLDTGVDLTHPDLQPNLWVNPGEIPGNSVDDDGNGYVDDIHGADMFTNGAPQDNNGHGTHVAGIIAAVRGNGTGIAGAAPNVKILAVKMLAADGSGSVLTAIKAVDYLVDLAVNRGVTIFLYNNSWGGFIPVQELPELQAAFARADALGILSTAAAGNGGSDNRGDNINSLGYFPAKFVFSNQLTVAATDFSGRISSFSNFGETSVHVAAPGGRIRSLLSSTAGADFGSNREGGTVVVSGTSMSTPYAAGVLALIRSHFTGLSNIEVRDRLLNRVYPLNFSDTGKTISGGRVNAFYALTDGEIPVPTPLPGPVVEATSTPTATPTSTPTGTPSATMTSTPSPSPPTAAPTAAAPVEPAPSLSVAPISANTQGAGALLSAKESNVIKVEIPGTQDLAGLRVKISAGDCVLSDIPAPALRYSSMLRFKKAGKGFSRVNFQLTRDDGTVLVDISAQVSGAKKQKKKLSCKALKKSVVITNPGG